LDTVRPYLPAKLPNFSSEDLVRNRMEELQPRKAEHGLGQPIAFPSDLHPKVLDVEII
jgi:hypothetical protein